MIGSDVCVVVGAASGIGRATTRLLAAEADMTLLMVDKDEIGLKELAQEIEITSPAFPIVSAVGNALSECFMAEVFEAAHEIGRVRGSVFTVGEGAPGYLENMSVAKFDRSIDTNLRSAFLFVREVLRCAAKMSEVCHSSVLVSSKTAVAPGANFGVYSVTKAAVSQLARVAAIEAGRYGTRINVVAPGPIFLDSKFWTQELLDARCEVNDMSKQELRDHYRDRTLLNREVSTNDVALAIRYLLSDDSAATTGSILSIDGGCDDAFLR